MTTLLALALLGMQPLPPRGPQVPAFRVAWTESVPRWPAGGVA